MLKNLIKMLFAVMSLVIISFSYSSASTSVTLDGIANAGYWADDLTSTYLYVKDLADDSYYYQWRYGDPDALRWSNLDDVVADLNTQGFSWWLESGGDPFNKPSSPIWTSVFLEKGEYEINLAPDSSAYNLSDYWGGNTWNAYVQIWAGYGDSFNFGEGSYISASENDALDYYHATVDGMTFSLKEDSNLYFYINDTNSIDNSGSVKLNVSVVPEPGQVLLFISGALPLAFWRQRKKVWSMLKQAVHKQ
ncbi:MAG: hypothetical protein C4560_00675 [Nitrospiraceae bacterium]|nr:MAG: hypothetical protein C4560_00675 [Nitrospiraceae bacterium]